jgi:alkenylglycerophosphocholine hydrolase
MIDGLGVLPILTIAVFSGFLLDWAAVWFNWHSVKPFSKPMAMVLVILWSLTAVSWQVNLLLSLLLMAQIFGLVGDVCLLFPRRWFKWGLHSFFVGHLFYIGILTLLIIEAHATGGVSQNVYRWFVLSLVVWGLQLGGFYLIFKPVSELQLISRSLWVAVQMYASLLSGMVALTFLTVVVLPGVSWRLMPLLSGSVLFFISDTLLAYDKFVSNLLKGRLWVRITYHLAQFCLAWGFISIIERKPILFFLTR